MLKIYNTITRKKQLFVSVNPNKVNIYVCGVTVYDYCHIGHARTYLFFDAVIRYLKFLGYEVNFIRNITDVDDKILNASKQSNQSFESITNKFIQAMQQDFATLNLSPPSFEPKATEFIQAMINLINDLLSKNYAYIGNNGDVFYSVNKFKKYGSLSKRDFNNMQNTCRVEQEVQDAKQELQDFVLWKLVDRSDIGWQSPWGYGRPGWHTECAAMSLQLFDNTIDIHGGGFDLMFPHHENEIAQSEASTCNIFVNYWMHVGFLQINQEKMSKSLGNYTLIKDILKEIHPEVLRYFMLSSHYRSQIEFAYDKLQTAKNSLERLYIALRNVPIKFNNNDLQNEVYQKYAKKFQSAMDDDFNTPVALAILFELSKELNIVKEKSIDQAKIFAATLTKLANTIGLLMFDCEQFLHHKINSHISLLSDQQIQNLIEQRNQARKLKDWQTADLIRNQLAKDGILLEDQGETTIWRRQ